MVGRSRERERMEILRDSVPPYRPPTVRWSDQPTQEPLAFDFFPAVSCDPNLDVFGTEMTE